MADAGDVGVADAQADAPEQASSIFSSYSCRSLNIGVTHPGDIAEATSLSSVLLPPSTYPLLEALPRELVEKGTLSSLQLEGALYAATKHQQILPSGQRAGFFIGDGAGVGKGRQIAAVMLDNYVRGRRKHIWLSISSDLRLDAQRDLRDLGSHINVINNVQTLDKETRALGLSKSCQHGVLFLTYSSLIAKGRLQQVIDWCGGAAFDGCLVFDECHKAKNFVAGNEGASTKMSAAVLELQNRLPMARVLYCSATGVSEVGHMAYLSRMGLWGPGTAFKDFDAFLTSMKKRGVSFLEMLAMEMKSEGKYVARGLSFRDAEFTEMEAKLTPEQTRLYDAAVDVWRKVKYGLSCALDLTGTSGRDVWKMFWSAQQRFFKLLCVSMKIPTVVAEARAALDSGCAVIIGLQTTGESADSYIGLQAGMVIPEPGISTTREMLLYFIRTHFPVKTVPPPKTPQDNPWGNPENVDPDGFGTGQSRQVKECVEMRQELIDCVNALQLPPNFLDQLLDMLGGPEQVAEMTGRKGRVVRRPKGRTGSELVYEARAKPDSQDMDSLNVREKDLFMNGKRHVAIISDAASTGISLHASRTAVNQRRRVHLTIELPWSADKAIQQLGRSHRSNQSSGPVYKLISTQVGGEKRFAAAVARRLQSLGALTRGDRRAASGIDLSEQNFDSPLGRRSLKRMYDAIVLESPNLPPGVSLASVLREQIKQQLNRPDMTDEEAESLAEVADPHLRMLKILALHKQLREYVDIMGVGVGAAKANPNDTTAENTDGVKASETADKGSGKGKDSGDVKRFLNRLLGLPLQHQNLLFSYFTATLTAEIAAAKKDGKYSEGLSDLRSSRIRVEQPPSVLWEDPMSGLKTIRNEFVVDRGVSYQEALSKLNHELGGATDKDTAANTENGFRRSRRPMFGMHMILLALQTPGSRNHFTIIRPNTGQGIFDLERDELDLRYYPVTPEEAKEEWEIAYDMTLKHCIHGQHCAQGPSCPTGRRLNNITVLSGSVVRVWGTLEAVLGRHEMELSRAERIMRVVRVELPRSDQAAGHTLSKATPSKAKLKSPGSHSTSPHTKHTTPPTNTKRSTQQPATETPASPSTEPQGASQQGEQGQHTRQGQEGQRGASGQSQDADDDSKHNITGQTKDEDSSDDLEIIEDGGAGSTPSAGKGDKTGAGTGAMGSPSTAAGSAALEAASPNQHIVGVRYPSHLLSEVVTALQLSVAPPAAAAAIAGVNGPAAAAIAALLAANIAQEAVAKPTEEPATPVDKKWLSAAFRPPKTMEHYFKASASGASSGTSVNTSKTDPLTATQPAPTSGPSEASATPTHNTKPTQHTPQNTAKTIAAGTAGGAGSAKPAGGIASFFKRAAAGASGGGGGGGGGVGGVSASQRGSGGGIGSKGGGLGGSQSQPTSSQRQAPAPQVSFFSRSKLTPKPPPPATQPTTAPTTAPATRARTATVPRAAIEVISIDTDDDSQIAIDLKPTNNNTTNPANPPTTQLLPTQATNGVPVATGTDDMDVMGDGDGDGNSEDKDSEGIDIDVDMGMGDIDYISDVELVRDAGVGVGVGVGGGGGEAVGGGERVVKKARLTHSESPSPPPPGHTAAPVPSQPASQPQPAAPASDSTVPGAKAGATASAKPGPASAGKDKGSASGSGGSASSGQSALQELQGMGFSARQAQRALSLAQGNLQRAVEMCLQGL